MLPRDAQDSLDTIHRLQDRSIDEYVDHGFARRYVLPSALMVFVAFASFDLPGPWNTFAIALGLGLAAMVCVSWQRQARVHRRPTGLEQLYYLGAGIVFLVACVAFQVAAAVAAVKLGMPAHHTVAAAATALMVVATAYPARKALRAVARHAVAEDADR
ncbi:hypothetical protein [Rugosimonospora africana]|uniref:Uncharacterized protein n=1 Tax=Rugosimonospora africana TaxID=556532 RepID=A0A8J3QQM4_9ACTN|nr:hypothetical protein [Rugosimonospora africana]GIH14749.1 hypothetical protein Raf01_29210 [Rugosimonospora africana]